jgi:hypothetical protein
VILDPVGRGASVRRWIDLDAARTARARYRGYAEPLEHLRGLDMA